MRWLNLSLALTLVACGSSQDDGGGESAGLETVGGGGSSAQATGVGGMGTGVTTNSGGSSSTAGTSNAGGATNAGGTSNAGGATNAGGANNTGGSRNTGGSAGMAGSSKPDAGSGTDAGRLPPDPCIAAGTCPVGVWTNVTPAGMDPKDIAPTMNAFGPGAVVADPGHASDLYVGGSDSGLWKSTDYGFTWKPVSKGIPYAPRGVTIAVAGTTPATIWGAGYNNIFKSTDGGVTFTETKLNVSLYSFQVDPNDPTHLISGLHEADGVYESTDGGTSWKNVSGPGFPSGGVSWYPFFIKTAQPATSRTTWFAIAQNGASAIMTSDSGAHWAIPNGLSGLNHPHGNSQIFQSGNSLFVAGVGGPGQGVYRSADLGVSWARVDNGSKPEALVWGSAKNVYAMYAWACSNCNLGTNAESAPLPGGTTWTASSAPAIPKELVLGPNSVAVTYDGTHYIFTAVMWSLGLWHYVEP
jgi:hypothetical protein